MLSVLSVSSLIACESENIVVSQQQKVMSSEKNQKISVEKIFEFKEPWALQELPNGNLLITEKVGSLKLFNPITQKVIDVLHVPNVAYGGQGGLGDVRLHPEFHQNSYIYLSYVEAEQELYGAVVIRAQLNLTDPNVAKLENIERIWVQTPKVRGQGHYAHRIVFDHVGDFWISSGERQQFDPAQDLKTNLGKIIRLSDDGNLLADNPFQDRGEVAKQIWSLGHRNPLGLAFDPTGKLWVAEMGPQGGDELNLIVKGKNYGYPWVSNGDHYDGRDIPDHHTRPEFKAPKLDWTPVISPSSLIFYTGDVFPEWQNKALIGGLSSKAIIVVDTQANPVKEIQRIAMKQRIRALLQAQDGTIWVLEDGQQAGLLRITKPH